jgi:chromosome segregation ATPase
MSTLHDVDRRQRIDLLQERRDVRELLIEQQEKCDAEINTLHKRTQERYPIGSETEVPESYLETIEEIEEVIDHLNNTKEELEELAKRYESLNRDLRTLDQ